MDTQDFSCWVRTTNSRRRCAAKMKMKSAEKAVISIVCRLGKEYRRDDQNPAYLPRQEMPDLKKELYNEYFCVSKSILPTVYQYFRGAGLAKKCPSVREDWWAIFLANALRQNMMHFYREAMYDMKYILGQKLATICFDIFSMQVQGYRHGK